jgi:hypothetical protein
MALGDFKKMWERKREMLKMCSLLKLLVLFLFSFYK